jgi:hypothetical protein
MLIYSVVALIISIFLMWYAIANAVTNPVLRPLVVRTPNRMAMINIARLATTVMGVAGVWYSRGWLAGILTYTATEVIRSSLLRRYTAVAIRELTTNLLEWQPGVGSEAARQAAAESVHAWIRGKG